MKTRHKIAVAKALYRTVTTARRVIGRSDKVVVSRRGLNYELNLSEGVDLAIYLLGAFEPLTRNALARNVRPGMTVLDIGANVGSHTLFLAELVGPSGHVYAFEPTAFAYAKLSRNLALNPLLQSRVIAQQCFLIGNDCGRLPDEVWSSWPLAGGGDLHPKHLGAQKSTAGARARTLDSILADNGNPTIHVIKLDVDGFECDVISGASRTMSRHKPIFVMELAPDSLQERGRSLESLMSLFLPLGYRLFHERTGKELPTDVRLLSGKIREGESINVVAKCGD